MKSRQTLIRLARSAGCVAALAVPLLAVTIVEGADPPCCDGSAPHVRGKCGTGSTCPAPDGDGNCTGTAVVQADDTDCQGTGTASQYCGGDPNGLCTSTYYCMPQRDGSCKPGFSTPVRNPDGTPVTSRMMQGVFMTCRECS